MSTLAPDELPEVEFVRNALLRDAGLSASTWLQKADAQYEHPGNPPIKRLPQTQDELNDFDAVVVSTAEHTHAIATGGGAQAVAREPVSPSVRACRPLRCRRVSPRLRCLPPR